jgi:hypothetical protein
MDDTPKRPRHRAVPLNASLRNPRRKRAANGDDGNPSPSMSDMAALGELICDLNPYTGVTDAAAGTETGKMSVGMLPAAPDPDPNNPTAPAPAPGAIGSFGIEIERNYGAKWTFKGQDLTVKTAVRIPYRFPVNKNGRTLYWQTEYLFIGYAGAEGGG